MNEENDLRSSKELPFENEIVVQTYINFQSIKEIVEYAETLIKDEKFDDFCHMLKVLCQENTFHMLLEEEAFLTAYLRYQLHIQRFEDVIEILEKIESTSNPIFLELWEEVHYRQYWSKHGKLTPLHKYRVRQRNPPPAGLCADRVRPHRRLLRKTSTVFREWFDKHSTYPYPCKTAKLALARRAGVSVSQVTAWFANARRKEKIKQDKSRHPVCSVNATRLDEQEPETKDLKRGIKRKTFVNNSTEVLHNVIEQNKKMVEENDENKELSTILTTENEKVLSDLLPVYTENIPSWSSNLPATVQTESQRNAPRLPFREFTNNCTSTLTQFQENVDKRSKYLDILPEDGFYEEISQTDDRTVFIHDEDGIKPCHKGGKKEYTLHRCSYLEKKVGVNKKVPNIFDTAKYKEDNMPSNKKDIHDYEISVKTGNKLKFVTKNDKDKFAKKKLLVETVTKSNNGAVIRKMAEMTSDINVRARYVKTANTKHVGSLCQSRHQSVSDNCNDESKYRQIRPKLKLEELHCEIKVPNESSMQKLREKLTEQRSKKRIQNRRSDSCFTALNSLKSLQKLCDNVEEEVISPKDYACSVKIESQTISDVDDITADENNTITRQNTQNDVDFESVSEMKNEVENMGNMCKLDSSIKKDTKEKITNEISKRNDIVDEYEKEWLAAMNDTPPILGKETRFMFHRESRKLNLRKIQTDQLVPSSPEVPYSIVTPLVPSSGECLYSPVTPLIPSSTELPFSPVTTLVPSSPDLLFSPETISIPSSTVPYPLVNIFPELNTSSMNPFERSPTEVPCTQEIICRSSLEPSLTEIHRKYSFPDALEKQNLQDSYLEAMSALASHNSIGCPNETGWSTMKIPSTNNHFGISIDSDNYGTVVGEAIQGLLNLSSSQESSSCCLDSTFI